MAARPIRPRPDSTTAWTVLLASAAWLAAACSSPAEPDPQPLEPEPFTNPRSVRLWIYATGIVLQPADTFRQGFFVDETTVSYELRRCPADFTYSCPSDLRSAWWSSDPAVLTVDSTGLISAVGPGEAAVWLQVESERDSALVRVVPGGGDVGATFESVAAGGAHTCALDSDGAPHCWGGDRHAALGRGDPSWYTIAAAPARVRDGPAFVQLAAGDAHTCGLAAGGETWCWGKNRDGQVGNGQFDNPTLPREAGVPKPVQVVGGLMFDTLVAADEATCGLVSGVAYCWGWNFLGELGIGSPDPQDDRAQPTPVAGGLAFRLLGAGDFHFCGVTFSDETYCWGEHNRSDAASTEGRSISNVPVLVAGAPPFVALAAGLAYTCGLTAARETYCWGYNDRGQLGHGDVDGSDSPTLLGGGHEFVALTAGTQHTCGLTAGGQAYCWGQNDYGQLGNGDRNYVPNPDPQPVSGSLTFQSLTAGFGHSCGITSTGAAYCWGGLGWLGIGEVAHVSAPLGGGHPVRTTPTRAVAPTG